MTDPDDSPYDPPGVHCRHWIGCRTFWQQPDPSDPDGGYIYSLGGLVISVQPSASEGYPFHIHRLFFYAQLTGSTGEYTARVRLVRITVDESGEDAETQVESFGPWEIPVDGGSFADSYGFPVRNVPFDLAGVYEFQLWLDEFDEPLARERIEARRVIDAD